MGVPQYLSDLSPKPAVFVYSNWAGYSGAGVKFRLIAAGSWEKLPQIRLAGFSQRRREDAAAGSSAHLG